MPIIITDFQLILIMLLVIFALGLTVMFTKPISRYFINRITDDALAKLFTESYNQNLAHLLPLLKRLSVFNLIEMSLRAESGKVIKRPLGSPRHYPGYDNLMFSPRQMTRFPLPENAKIDMNVTLGSRAEKPLTIKIPLMIGGMAYGTALSEEAKIALAKASKTLNTATNSGEGPFLPEEPKEAGKFILQICRWSWGDRTDEQIAAAHMLEVQMGQGGNLGVTRTEASEIEGRARILAGLAPGEPAIGLISPPGIRNPEDWPTYIEKLRQRANGIPIALKLMATDNLEQELATAMTLGFDVIAIDGAEGGSHGSAPTIQDDLGLPCLYTLVRAKRFLQNSRTSLVISGGYFTPGQCLKALALGADAIYLGTIPLFALVHNQIEKVAPWEPPTTLVYYSSPTKIQLDINLAATSIANALNSMVLEMEEAMRALGKASLKELSSDDLIALDSITAELTGVKQVFGPSTAPKISYTVKTQKIRRKKPLRI